MKRKIRLSESDIHRIVKESVKKIIKEEQETDSISMLAQLLTDLDENTAESVASEISFACSNGYNFDEMVQYLSDKLNPMPYGQM